MKWTFTKEDLSLYQQKYGADHAVAGYAEKAQLTKLTLPKYYVVVIDDQKLSLVHLSMKLEEKEVTQIPLAEIRHVKVSGMLVKKVVMETSDATYKLRVNPLGFGLGDVQKALVKRLEELESNNTI